MVGRRWLTACPSHSKLTNFLKFHSTKTNTRHAPATAKLQTDGTEKNSRKSNAQMLSANLDRADHLPANPTQDSHFNSDGLSTKHGKFFQHHSSNLKHIAGTTSTKCCYPFSPESISKQWLLESTATTFTDCPVS